jgi:hypothetical protein
MTRTKWLGIGRFLNYAAARSPLVAKRYSLKAIGQICLAVLSGKRAASSGQRVAA